MPISVEHGPVLIYTLNIFLDITVMHKACCGSPSMFLVMIWQQTITVYMYTGHGHLLALPRLCHQRRWKHIEKLRANSHGSIFYLPKTKQCDRRTVHMLWILNYKRDFVYLSLWTCYCVIQQSCWYNEFYSNLCNTVYPSQSVGSTENK